MEKHLSFRPSMIVVSLSGGKDSTAAFLATRAAYPDVPIICHHQIIPEDWEGTVEHCQKLCDLWGVELVTEQACYMGYRCTSCEHHWLSAKPKPKCQECGQETGQHIATVRGLVDLMWWRRMWPSKSVRWCTSYLKRDLFDKWARRNREMLGPNPVLVTGERWLESANRAKLPYISPRSDSMAWLTEWRPILHYTRRDAFRAGRDWPLHYCYELQGFTQEEMFEIDAEGGPRMSCRCCIFLPAAQMKHNAALPGNEELFNELMRFERETGHTFRQGISIESLFDRPEQLSLWGKAC